jgi:hypothetical protein
VADVSLVRRVLEARVSAQRAGLRELEARFA